MRARAQRTACARLAAKPAVISVSRVSRSVGPRRAITGVRFTPGGSSRRGRPPYGLAALALAGDHLEPDGLRPPLADIPLKLLDRVPVGSVESLQPILAAFRPGVTKAIMRSQ